MYDAIVVGARCAGAPTAMLLARQGHKVLLLDRDEFPSDIMSTHFLHLPGKLYLHRWGLLDRVMDTLKVEEPTSRKAGVRVENVEALVEKLRNEAKVI